MSNKRQLTKSEKRVIAILAIAAAVAFGIFAALLYINDYYEATEKAKKALLGNYYVVVEETDAYYRFKANPVCSYLGPAYFFPVFSCFIVCILPFS